MTILGQFYILEALKIVPNIIIDSREEKKFLGTGKSI